jgi:hypothetical protein
MIEDIVGNNGTRFIIAAGAVALGLLCLVAVLRFMRNRPSSPFIRGGKNRQPRLAVLDAAAIDTRRRLVLVRRDDVEHLIMIGGPTDVVIESRIVSQSQTAQPATITAAATPETIATRPAVEPAVPERRVAERRVVPQPETRAAPVSAMGQVLYGDSDDGPAQPVRAAQQSAQVRPQSEATPAMRQPLPERTVAIPSQQARPQPLGSTTMPQASVSASRPEDILEAARARVLAANQPISGQRSQNAIEPAPLAAAQATVPAIQTQPAVQSQPATQSQPVVQGQPAIQAQKDPSGLEFERILDAEITGDLGKLTIDDIRVEAEQRANSAAANPTVRQEPRLGVAQGNRNEPSLEDEMNRMLSEISVNRKN